MMPKARTLLPPAPDEAIEAESPHSLAGVGVHAVLGAMIEQRRASQVAAEELEDEEPVPPTLRNGQEKKSVKRRDPTSDVFLKAR